MRPFIILLFGAITVSVVGVLFIRDQALRHLDAVGRELQVPAEPERFDSASLAGLPPPARRYLAHAIAPGTPLARSVRLTLAGDLRLSQGGPLAALQAEEILAPPKGFLWRGTVGAGLGRRSGFELYVDGRALSRWWLWGWLPIVNDSSRGHMLSESARVAFESIWLPTALLPRRDVTWTGIDADRASARVVVDGEPHELAIAVDAEGRLQSVRLERWDPSARRGEGDRVPFVIDEIEEERTFDGFTLPVRFRAAWQREEANLFDVYFPVLEAAEFTPPAPEKGPTAETEDAGSDGGIDAGEGLGDGAVPAGDGGLADAAGESDTGAPIAALPDAGTADGG